MKTFSTSVSLPYITILLILLGVFVLISNLLQLPSYLDFLYLAFFLPVIFQSTLFEKYKITDKELIITGPFRKLKILFVHITQLEIKESTNFEKFAMSLAAQTMAVSYNTYDEVILSPKDHHALLQILQQRSNVFA